jgi:hypothetical protein
MSDKKIMTGEDEDDIEIVEVDVLPTTGEPPKAAADDEDDDEVEPPVKVEPEAKEGDEEEDDEDARLAEADEEDADSKPRGKNWRKNKKAREAAREGKLRSWAEVDFLRQRIAEQDQRIAELAGTQQAFSKGDIDSRIAAVEADIRTAEQIHAQAIEAGNGTDAVAAMKLRDEARDSLVELRTAKKAYEVQPTTSAQQVELVNRWKSQNPWFGSNPVATQIATTIDAQVAADGYNPATPAYYQELSRRTQAHFDATRKAAEEPEKRTAPKKAPPLGSNGRENGSAPGKNQVYVTPDRVQAMKDAGMWDDPASRRKMLKAYADFDREQSAGR